MGTLFAYIGPFLLIVGLLLMIVTVLYVAIKGMQVGFRASIDMMSAFLLISSVLVLGFALIWNLSGVVWRDWMTKGDTADYISGQWSKIGVVDQKQADQPAPKVIAPVTVYTEVLATFDQRLVNTKSGSATEFNALTQTSRTLTDADKIQICGWSRDGRLIGCPVHTGKLIAADQLKWMEAGISIPPQLLPATPIPTKVIVTPAQCKAKFVRSYNSKEFEKLVGASGVPIGYSIMIIGPGATGYIPMVGNDTYEASIEWGIGVEPTKFRMAYAKGAEFGIWRISTKTVAGTNTTLCAP
ncbi:MAG: hypothetical protein Q8L37_07760 [Candidatus Gottesmanbacteria bacterium]|nr:hypothetical protein [Candidatus Gottesmanbacteria bacterium]